MENNIHEAILAIMGEVGYVQKQNNPKLGYTYAGEAALIAALRPSMVKHGVFIYVSQVIRASRENYTTAKGTAMANTLIQNMVTFVHAPSGTSIEVACVGEGSDSGDKSANKASTGAYKYALRQTFCIETGDDPDDFPSEERIANAIREEQDKIPSQDKEETRKAFEKHAEKVRNNGDVTDTDADEKFPKMYTVKEIKKSADRVDNLAKESGRQITEVLAHLKTLEPDKKYMWGALVKELETVVY